MRMILSVAAAALAGFVAVEPAAAFDDSLPRYAPYGSRVYVHHHVYVPRYRHLYHFHTPRPHHLHVIHGGGYRWAWRHRYYRPKLGGYFVRNPDFRRIPLYR